MGHCANIRCRGGKDIVSGPSGHQAGAEEGRAALVTLGSSDRFVSPTRDWVEYVHMNRQSTQQHESRQDRLAASSVRTRLSLAMVIAVPWLLTLPPAMFGVQSNPLVGLYGLIGAAAGNSYRDRDFLKLPGPLRRKVIAVQRSGQLSGDRTLDQIALDRLQRAARAARSERILLPILLTIYVATPIVAAIRDNGWWLLCLLPAAVVAVLLPATWPREDPRVQRDRLPRTLSE